MSKREDIQQVHNDVLALGASLAEVPTTAAVHQSIAQLVRLGVALAQECTLLLDELEGGQEAGEPEPEEPQKSETQTKGKK